MPTIAERVGLLSGTCRPAAGAIEAGAWGKASVIADLAKNSDA